MRVMKLVLAVLIPVLFVQLANAEEASEVSARTEQASGETSPALGGLENTVSKGQPDRMTDYVSPKLTPREYVLAFALLAFGVCVLVMEFIQFSKQRDAVSAQDMLLVYSVTLIIVGTMFLIVVGVSSNQIAPAFGLYGTIVGYLLGRRSGRNDASPAAGE